MWAGRWGRRPDEAAKSEGIPPELECFSGHCGPYIKTDRAEFHHAHPEAQQWFLRLDPEELADFRYSVKSAKVRREIKRWMNRALWAGIGSFAAVAAAGEKFAKLPETISGAISAGSQLWTVLLGLLGK